MNQHAKRRSQQGGALKDPPPPPPPPETPPRPAAPLDDSAGPRTVTADADHADARLDKFLAATAGLSRTRIQALIEAGRVTIDGAAASDTSMRLRAGQSVTIDVPPPAPAIPVGEKIALTVAFEDEYLIIVDKPAGLVVHPSAGHETGTLVNALIAHCGASLSGVGGVMRPGIVHRLDKDTSGLMVVAKTDAAHQGLAALFADHGRTLSLTREYLAFAWGAPERSHGRVETFLGRHPHNREKQAVVKDETRGRHAVTHFTVEKTYGHLRGGVIASLVRCALETGRTHQIRVHLAHLGHPLLGDAVYGAGFKTKIALLGEAAASVETLGRQALHAATLGFEHPVTGEPMLFESELPADLAKLRQALEKVT